jgi:Co/Zn/Cd efflux system component
MLFDCTALFIGLVAAVIANWEHNFIFSYGYSIFNSIFYFRFFFETTLIF